MSNRARPAATGRRRQRAGRPRSRWRRWIPAASLAALTAAGLAGYGMWRHTTPDEGFAVPAAVTSDQDGVRVGDGPVTVEVYFDFLCPYCRRFDAAARPMLDSYLASGAITLVYRPIAILDSATSTGYSTRSAAAAGCAADGGRIDAFVGAMLAAQPPEGSVGLSDDEIVQIGARVGLTDPGFGQCVRDGAYRDWAAGNTEAAADRGVVGTPTVVVQGVAVAEATEDSVRAAIQAHVENPALGPVVR